MIPNQLSLLELVCSGGGGFTGPRLDLRADGKLWAKTDVSTFNMLGAPTPGVFTRIGIDVDWGSPSPMVTFTFNDTETRTIQQTSNCTEPSYTGLLVNVGLGSATGAVGDAYFDDVLLEVGP
jgi:hypothetical protein